MRYRVKVWNKDIEIEVCQKPGTKTVWIAVGTYMNEAIEVKGSSAASAAKHWADAAKYRGN